MGVVGQILAEFRNGKEVGIKHGAADAPGGFGKIAEAEAGEGALFLHVTLGSEIDDFALVETPRFGGVIVDGLFGIVVALEASLAVLLQNHNGREAFERGVEAANVPETAVFTVAEKVTADGAGVRVVAAGKLLEDIFFHRASVGGGGVIEGGGKSGGEQPEQQDGREEADDAASGAEDRDDFVAPGHLGERVEDGEEQADRQADEDDLGNAEEIKLREKIKRGFVLQESRCILAEVENQPDGNKPRDAIKEGLENANENIPVKNLHAVGAPRLAKGDYPAADGRHQLV